jgi:hypothetical protein
MARQSPGPVCLLPRVPASGGCDYHGLSRAPVVRRGQSAEEARERLLALGRLMVQKGSPESDPGELLLSFPLLLTLLKDRRQALAKAGLGRGEWIAAAQLFVELHDLAQAEEVTEEEAARGMLLHGALRAFRLQAATCLHTVFPGEPEVLAALRKV